MQSQEKMKPDLMITWIKHADYPIFRATLKKYRDFFGKVIILFSEHNRFPYFDHFIQSSLSDLDVTFLDPKEYVYGVEDWRNVSTNEMLKYSTSEWVCSVEQDWFSTDWKRLLDITINAMPTSDLIGWWQSAGKYIHPGYWFMKRESLEKTNKDFAAHDGLDHFGWITKDAERLGMKITTLQDLGFNCDVSPEADCFHLGGVNQNYLEGLKDDYVFHRPAIFFIYNYWCRQAKVKQDPRFLGLSQDIEAELLKRNLGTDLLNNEWNKFFM